MAISADAPKKRIHLWHHHPHVRSGDELTLGEKAADRLRNGMGSWPFVFGALIFLAIWMAGNANKGFDKYPFILLNLLLSCLGAMQGAILLIAAKRSDQVASELAAHDYEQDCRSAQMLERLTAEFEALRRQHEDLHRHMNAVMTTLRVPVSGPGIPASGAFDDVPPAVPPTVPPAVPRRGAHPARTSPTAPPTRTAARPGGPELPGRACSGGPVTRGSSFAARAGRSGASVTHLDRASVTHPGHAPRSRASVTRLRHAPPSR